MDNIVNTRSTLFESHLNTVGMYPLSYNGCKRLISRCGISTDRVRIQVEILLLDSLQTTNSTSVIYWTDTVLKLLLVFGLCLSKI